MPKAAPSRCTEQGCADFATHQGRCEQHRRRAWGNVSARNRALDPTRWTRTVRAHLAIEPSCRICRSTDHLQVDHITEVADGGALYDHANLQTLCESCHDDKTRQARELRAALRAAADLDSW